MNYKSKLTALILFLSILSNANSVSIKKFINSTPFEIEITDNVEGSSYTLEPHKVFNTDWDVSIESVDLYNPAYKFAINNNQQFNIKIIKKPKFEFIPGGIWLIDELGFTLNYKFHIVVYETENDKFFNCLPIGTYSEKEFNRIAKFSVEKIQDYYKQLINRYVNNGEKKVEDMIVEFDYDKENKTIQIKFSPDNPTASNTEFINLTGFMYENGNL